MDECMRLARAEKGTVPVYLHIPAEKLTLLAPIDAWCSGSDECLRALTKAFGGENVKMTEAKAV